MGYIFLIASLFCGAVKGFCGKKTSTTLSGFNDALLASFVRMLMCIVIGFVLLVFEGNIGYLIPNTHTLVSSAFSGISTSVFVITWLIAVKTGAYMMLDVFLMTGVAVPILLDYMFFSTTTGIGKLLGLGILIISAVIMCSYNNTIKEKMKPRYVILLFVCGIANGLTDFSQRFFVRGAQDTPSSVFNLYTYIFSAIFIGLALACFKFKNCKKEGIVSSGKLKGVIGYIVIMSICLFAHSLFKTNAASYLSSDILYPVSQGASLIISSIMAAMLFGEKITLRSIIGLITAFVGVVIVNVAL